MNNEIEVSGVSSETGIVITPDSPVEHPNHYNTGKYEVIDVINDWELNFQKGNAVKYIARAGHKEADKEIEDLEKARFYIDYEINRLKKIKEKQ